MGQTVLIAEVAYVAETVYILCTATSLLCAVLLGRGYARTHARLLLWSCLCFVFLSLNNGLLLIDKVVFPDVELAVAAVSVGVIRSVCALIGLLLLVFGLVWDSQ